MRAVLLRSLLVAVLIGPLVTFVSTIVSTITSKPIVAYEPGISEAEFKSYDSRSVSDLNAFLKSREVKLTGYRALRESIGYGYFWKGRAITSLIHSIGIFLGCIIFWALQKRAAQSQESTPSE